MAEWMTNQTKRCVGTQRTWEMSGSGSERMNAYERRWKDRKKRNLTNEGIEPSVPNAADNDAKRCVTLLCFARPYQLGH